MWASICVRERERERAYVFVYVSSSRWGSHAPNAWDFFQHFFSENPLPGMDFFFRFEMSCFFQLFFQPSCGSQSQCIIFLLSVLFPKKNKVNIFLLVSIRCNYFRKILKWKLSSEIPALGDQGLGLQTIVCPLVEFLMKTLISLVFFYIYSLFQKWHDFKFV